MADHVLYEQDGGVVTLTLNQPERRNPISEADMVEALVSAVERLGADASVRVAVLTGVAGRDVLEPEAEVVLESIAELPGWIEARG